MKRGKKQAISGKLVACIVCRTSEYSANMVVVRCLACGWRRHACPSCAPRFVGCDETCNKKHREMMAQDFGKNQGYDLLKAVEVNSARPQKDKTPNPWKQGRLF